MAREESGRHDPDWDYLVGVAKHANEESDARFFIFARSEALMQPTLDLRDTIDVKPGNVAKKIDFLGSLPAFERARQAAPRLFSSLEETLHRGLTSSSEHGGRLDRWVLVSTCRPAPSPSLSPPSLPSPP